MGGDLPVNLDLKVRGLPNSATVAINERSNALLAQGREVFKLGLGQSPFPVPDEVVAALRAHAPEKDYLPVRGLWALREAVADYHNRHEGLDRTAEDVLIGPGSKELMFLTQLAFYGDLVIPTPAWVSYAPQARILGRRVHLMNTHRGDGWRLRPDALRAICREDPERPRLVILNYPANPTGGTFEADELKALADVCRGYRVLMLSDEIYGALHHEGQHVSIARYYPEGTIISSGLSKWCGAGGWRLGTFVFPPSLRWLLDAMASAGSETYTSTSAPIQYAAVSAFQGSEGIDRYLEGSRRTLRALGNWCTRRLREGGAHCDDPEGGFYLFPDLSAQRERLAARGVHDSAGLAETLLQDTGVALLPGSHFGRPAHELTVRLAYVDFDGGTALAELPPGNTDPDEAWLRQHCGRVTQAIDRFATWMASPGPRP